MQGFSGFGGLRFRCFFFVLGSGLPRTGFGVSGNTGFLREGGVRGGVGPSGTLGSSGEGSSGHIQGN